MRNVVKTHCTFAEPRAAPINRHTHERVDQVFSRFSSWLNTRDARTLSALYRELALAFSPSCNFYNLEGVLDMKEWYGDACPESDKVISLSGCYQIFVKRPDSPRPEGKPQADVFISEWSDTPIFGPEHLLQSIPEGKPQYLPGRYLFHSHKGADGKTAPLPAAEAEKQFAAMEKEIWLCAHKNDFSTADTLEWEQLLAQIKAEQTAPARPYPGFWPTSERELVAWRATLSQSSLPAVVVIPHEDDNSSARRRALNLPANVRDAVALEVDMRSEMHRLKFNPMTTIGKLRENDNGVKGIFDAKGGNLVIMNTADAEYAADEKPCLLGEWEATHCVGYVRARPEKDNEDETKRQLKLAVCEPWQADPKGFPTIPLWLAVELAQANGTPPPDTSWEAVKSLPWKEVRALPLRTFNCFYSNGRKARCTNVTDNFMNTGIMAYTTIGKLGSSGVVEITHPWSKLLMTLQINPSLDERNKGAILPQDALRFIECTQTIERLQPILAPHRNNDTARIEARERRAKMIEAHGGGKRRRGDVDPAAEMRMLCSLVD